MPNESTREFLLDVFRDIPDLRVKAMFGGFGIYRGDLMFALEADGQVYLKTDEINRPAFAERGLGPFVYEAKGGKQTVMSYHEAPPETLESPHELAPWARDAYAAAVRAAARKPKKGVAKKRRVSGQR